jgi:hypothetical protein
VPQYTIVVQNNSSSEGDVCVYQTDPNISDPKVMSLAWLTDQVPPTGTLSFTWNLDTIPSNQATVGIGMSGAGTFVTQAGPNTNLVFSPSLSTGSLSVPISRDRF